MARRVPPTHARPGPRRRHGRLGDGRDDVRRRHRGPGGCVPAGPGGEGRVRGRAPGPHRGHGRQGAAGPCAGGDPRHRGHRRRPPGHRQPLHHVLPGRRRRRGPGGETRQPGRVVDGGCGGRDRGPRRGPVDAHRQGGGVRRGRGHHLPVRPELPPLHEVRGARAQAAGRAHGVQLPGSAEQPRPGVRAGAGLLERGHGAAAGPGPGRPGRPRVRVPRLGRSRQDHHLRALHRAGGARGGDRPRAGPAGPGHRAGPGGGTRWPGRDAQRHDRPGAAGGGEGVGAGRGPAQRGRRAHRMGRRRQGGQVSRRSPGPSPRRGPHWSRCGRPAWSRCPGCPPPWRAGLR